MLYLITFIVAICSLVYEVLLSTLTSYLLGNSVVQFTLTMGFFLFGLGIGSFLSKFIKNNISTFLNVELSLGFLGGFSVIFIKLLYIHFVDYEFLFLIFYFLYVILIGTLTGFEVPILSELISKIKEKKVIGDVLGYDYIGSLIGTLLFPFLLLPYLGLTYTAFLVGFLNIIVTLIFLMQAKIKKELLEENKYLNNLLKVFIMIVLLFIGIIYSNTKFENIWDHFFYKEPIVLKTHSQYQDIIITKRGNDIRLLLNGHLQFLSLDEHRYHSSLYSQAKTYLQSMNGEKNILILGGGDGLLARNIIKSLSGNNFHITLVDLDPKITNLAKNYPLLVKLNKGSLNNKNVEVINEDAFTYLLHNKKQYDVIIADFPDPRAVEIAKLYSKEFYLLVKGHLRKNGIFTTQSGNAFFTKESFWCIYKTISSIKESPFAYHGYIPSFGDWGFIGFKKGNELKNLKGKYILTNFDKDYLVDLNKIKENTLDNEIIINYYLQGWKRFTE